MHSLSSLSQRINAKLQHCLNLAEQQYQHKWKMPRVVFSPKMTNTAGTARISEWKITLSTPLLMKNVDSFIDDVVPHELAHLIDAWLHPADHGFERVGEVFRWLPKFQRTSKRDIHGQQWREVLQRIGGGDISRCHTYDTVAVSNRRKYTYVCSTCSQTYQVGEKVHATMHRRRCKCGNSHLVLQGASRSVQAFDSRKVAAATTANIAAALNSAGVTPNKPQQVVVKASPLGTSKLDICRKLFLFNPSASRAELIRMFISTAGCTAAGASTYYQTLKKQHLG